MSEVALLRWPEEGAHAKELADAGVAVLYMIQEDADPPTLDNCLEDWVRIPGDERDLRARLAALQMRAGMHRRPPSLDAEGRLRHDGTVLALSPVQARLAGMLIAQFGKVVSDGDLAAPLGDGQSPSPLSLRAHMARLRSALRDVDLAVRRVPGRGYLLERR